MAALFKITSDNNVAQVVHAVMPVGIVLAGDPAQFGEKIRYHHRQRIAHQRDDICPASGSDDVAVGPDGGPRLLVFNQSYGVERMNLKGKSAVLFQRVVQRHRPHPSGGIDQDRGLAAQVQAGIYLQTAPDSVRQSRKLHRHSSSESPASNCNRRTVSITRVIESLRMGSVALKGWAFYNALILF